MNAMIFQFQNYLVYQLHTLATHPIKLNPLIKDVQNLKNVTQAALLQH